MKKTKYIIFTLIGIFLIFFVYKNFFNDLFFPNRVNIETLFKVDSRIKFEKNIFFSDISNVFKLSNKWLIFDDKHGLRAFNENGTYSHTIGKIGLEEPYSYSGYSKVFAFDSSKVAIADMHALKISLFEISGAFIKSIPFRDISGVENGFRAVSVTNNHIYFCVNDISKSKYRFLKYDKNFKLLSKMVEIDEKKRIFFILYF